MSAECYVCFENLTQEAMPSALPCGHVCCRECLERWLETKGECPFCKTEGEEITPIYLRMESSGNGDKVLDMLKKKAALVQAEIERIEGSGPFEQDFSGASELLDHLREVTGVLGGWTREGEILKAAQDIFKLLHKFDMWYTDERNVKLITISEKLQRTDGIIKALQAQVRDLHSSRLLNLASIQNLQTQLGMKTDEQTRLQTKVDALEAELKKRDAMLVERAALTRRLMEKSSKTHRSTAQMVRSQMNEWKQIAEESASKIKLLEKELEELKVTGSGNGASLAIQPSSSSYSSYKTYQAGPLDLNGEIAEPMSQVPPERCTRSSYIAELCKRYNIAGPSTGLPLASKPVGFSGEHGSGLKRARVD